MFLNVKNWNAGFLSFHILASYDGMLSCILYTELGMELYCIIKKFKLQCPIFVAVFIRDVQL